MIAASEIKRTFGLLEIIWVGICFHMNWFNGYNCWHVPSVAFDSDVHVHNSTCSSTGL